MDAKKYNELNDNKLESVTGGLFLEETEKVAEVSEKVAEITEKVAEVSEKIVVVGSSFGSDRPTFPQGVSPK